MDFRFLIRGLIIGFSIAAPVGPIGVLCIRRTLADGRMVGFVSGLGAATADAIYGCLAGFGLAAVADFLVNHQFWLSLLGGGYLSCLGGRILSARPAEQAAKAKGKGLYGAYFSTFFLTLTNPVTILFFGAIFAGVGLASAMKRSDSASGLILGIFLGSALWWLGLSMGVGIFREQITGRGLKWVNRISGGIILGFGILALAQML